MNLEEIKGLLNQEGIYSRLITKEGFSEPTHLEVDLDVDHHGREQYMLITSFSQSVTPEDTERFVRMEFTVELPFAFHNLTVSDTSRMINFINRFCQLPGFELDEVDQKIFYRHVHLGLEEKVNTNYLSSMLGLILMYIDINSPTIESVASGKRTFASSISEILSSNLLS